MKLSGDIDTASLLHYWPDREQLFAESEVHLDAVKLVDSAGLAFLVQWAKARLAAGSRLRLLSVPTQLQRLITMYGVGPLFDCDPANLPGQE
jgi:anti-anti-sigma factor